MSEICSALVFVIYDLCYLLFSMAGPIYQPAYPCGTHDVLSFGLLLVTIIVSGGDDGVRL